MKKIGFYLQNYFRKHMKSIHLMVIIGLPMMCFRKPAGCFHIIWHISVVRLQESVLKPENIDTSRPEKKVFSFLMKFEVIGTQLHRYRLLYRT